MHLFAFIFKCQFWYLTSVLAHSDHYCCTAFKALHEAGGRGGESTARWRWC
ncbi:hypothetical protein HMPREF9549_02728 [Escherichia coli MS 185-1]|nr:hypothetical protein HMPREF9549_02728 [Escherichia coli MS 185-1]